MPSFEIVSPAGSAEKLKYAWLYGADAVYIGVKRFSLRAYADNFYGNEYEAVVAQKKAFAARGNPKKLYCALNAAFHNGDLEAFKADIDYFRLYPFDAFIVQDMGLVDLLQKEFPDAALHLSTQANCLNKDSARFYSRAGFKRIVLARETTLDEIAEIKSAVPDIEIECFAHGAMCIAYSGRCLMSAYMSARSANGGRCAHSCRWDWKPALRNGEFFVEERERPGELFPIEENGGYTSLFSSRDLCMIDYLPQMKAAGIDALKIEGRMKSLYYTAAVTRAYRKARDALDGIIGADCARPFMDDVNKVSHREYCAGFYFSPSDADKTVCGKAESDYVLAGTIGAPRGEKTYEFNAVNKINAGTPLEYIGPDEYCLYDDGYAFVNPETGERLDWACHDRRCVLRTDKPLKNGYIARARVRG